MSIQKLEQDLVDQLQKQMTKERDSKPLEGKAKGGPVEDGADYIVGEKGPELFMPFKDGVVLPNDVSKKIAGGKIPLEKGGIALKDLEGEDLKAFQKYAQTRGQIESINFIRGQDRYGNPESGGKPTFEDIDPELKSRQDKIMRDNYEYGEKLKARGIDVEAHYNRPETGNEVNKTSTENIDLGRGANGGGGNNTVVSNNVSNNNTTKIVPMKANPRPEYTGSSLDRYNNRISVY
jgi:hypothetical protein